MTELNTIEKLNALIKMCKGSVSIEVNPHRDCYESIDKYIHALERIFLQTIQIYMHKF